MAPDTTRLTWNEWHDAQDGEARDVMLPGAVYECVRKAWFDQESRITSLQRELAEARRELAGYKLFVACVAEDCEDTDYQGDAQGILDHGVIPFLEERGSAPGPSDANGEEVKRDGKWIVCNFERHDGDAFKLTAILRGFRQSLTREQAITELADAWPDPSRASLTPLTSPIVRGVLVDDGEPTSELNDGTLYICGNQMFLPHDSYSSGLVWQPVKLRPASEFVVPAESHPTKVGDVVDGATTLAHVELWNKTTGEVFRDSDGELGIIDSAGYSIGLSAVGEQQLREFFSSSTPAEPAQKLVPLPEGAVVYRPASIREGGVTLPFRPGEWINCDPALYGVPVERAWDQTELHKAQCESIGLRAEVERQSERIASLTSAAETAEAEAERLRKAIETHRHKNTGMACDHKQSDLELWSALTSPELADEQVDRELAEAGIDMTEPNKRLRTMINAFKGPSAAKKRNETMETAWLLETQIGGSPVWFTPEHHSRRFTTDACKALKFPTKEAAEGYALTQSLGVEWKATEHGFYALTPPTAASGEFGVCMICGADLERADQCLACDKCEPPKQAEPKLAVNQPRTSCQSDAAESVGDAPLPIYTTSAPAAESEGGEKEIIRELAGFAREVAIGVSTPLCDSNAKLVAERDALSARLAASEERCKELEAGIEKHRREHQEVYGRLGDAEYFDEDLWSLLAPKGEGAG